MKILFHFVYDQTSMQNFSAINFTICGGRTLFREVNPIRESSSRYGLHHRMSVVTDTPALKANSDLDIAFIKSIFNRHYRSNIPLQRGISGGYPNPNLSFSLAQRKELKETSTYPKPFPIWKGCN